MFIRLRPIRLNAIREQILLLYSLVMISYIHSSQTERRDALVQRFNFPRASHKSKSQCSFIQRANNSKIQCSFMTLQKYIVQVRLYQ